MARQLCPDSRAGICEFSLLNWIDVHRQLWVSNGSISFPLQFMDAYFRWVRLTSLGEDGNTREKFFITLNGRSIKSASNDLLRLHRQ